MSIQTAAAETARTFGDLSKGEEITILETAEESGVDRLTMLVRLAPGAGVPPHAHPSQETFECVEGQVQFHHEGRTIEFTRGSTFMVASGKVHGIRNDSRAPATLRVEATHGAEMEYGLRLKMAMLVDGLFQPDGRPGDFLMGAVFLHQSGIWFPPLPAWLFRPMIATAAALGRWRGRERFLLAHYPDYARFLAARRTRLQ